MAFNIADLYKLPTPSAPEKPRYIPPMPGYSGFRATGDNYDAKKKLYDTEKHATSQFNAGVEGYGQQINDLSGKADTLYQKTLDSTGDATKYADQAYDTVTAQQDKANSYLDELKSQYADIIPETIAQARKGVLDQRSDFGGEMNRAEANVATKLAGERQGITRELSRFGVNPTSGRFASSQRNFALTSAADRAAAREQSRLTERDRVERAKQINFNARAGVMGQGQNLISSASKDTNALAGIAANAKLAGSAVKSRASGVYAGLADRYTKAASAAAKGLTAFALGNEPARDQNFGAVTKHYGATGLFAR